jgi:hypothetical protein
MKRSEKELKDREETKEATEICDDRMEHKR